VWVISGLASIFPYNQQIKKFWGEIGDDSHEHERVLTRDRRNRAAGQARDRLTTNRDV
jgi:hypothetical protein